MLDNWVTVPTNSVLTIQKQTVLIHPIKDEFYSRDPAHARNAAFASDRGLVSGNEGNVKVASSVSAGGTEVDRMRQKLEEVQVRVAQGSA